MGKKQRDPKKAERNKLKLQKDYVPPNKRVDIHKLIPKMTKASALQFMEKMESQGENADVMQYLKNLLADKLRGTKYESPVQDTIQEEGTTTP
jgi:GH25 family lysozyme M1 (1,4-beta-N-acetylmuramidase)